MSMIRFDDRDQATTLPVGPRGDWGNDINLNELNWNERTQLTDDLAQCKLLDRQIKEAEMFALADEIANAGRILLALSQKMRTEPVTGDEMDEAAARIPELIRRYKALDCKNILEQMKFALI